MTDKVRHFVHPGHMTSKSDGEVHFISFIMLCRLYKLNPTFAINASREDKMLGIRPREGDLHYYPRYNGDYEKGAENA